MLRKHVYAASKLKPESFIQIPTTVDKSIHL